MRFELDLRPALALIEAQIETNLKALRQSGLGAYFPADHFINQPESTQRMTSPSITIDGIEYVPATSVAPSETQVVIGLNGFVFVGNVTEERDELAVTNARSVTLEDGTLAFLVAGSPQGDECGTVRIPKGNVVARINVKAAA